MWSSFRILVQCLCTILKDLHVLELSLHRPTHMFMWCSSCRTGCMWATHVYANPFLYPFYGLKWRIFYTLSIDCIICCNVINWRSEKLKKNRVTFKIVLLYQEVTKRLSRSMSVLFIWQFLTRAAQIVAFFYELYLEKLSDAEIEQSVGD